MGHRKAFEKAPAPAAPDQKKLLEINVLEPLPADGPWAMIGAVGVTAVSRLRQGTIAQVLLDAPDIEEG